MSRPIEQSALPQPPPATGVGAAWAVFALFLPLLPLGLSGIVRAALHVPLWVGLVVGLLATFALLFACRRAATLPAPRDLWPLAIGAAGAVVLIVLLHNRELGMLVSVGGGDAGNHVSLQHEFVRERPDVYEKFITFYALTHWLGRIFHLGDYGAFAAGYLTVLVAVPLCVGAAAAVFQSALRGPARWVAGVVLAGLVAMAALRLWGPWLHYHQADGFYAHLFGLVPLLLGWLAYGSCEKRLPRLAVVVLLVAVIRFTYGLNLGDALVMAALLFVGEAVAASDRRWRIALLVGAVGLVGASVVAFWALAPLRNVPGAFVKIGVSRTLNAQLLLLLLLAAVGRWARPLLGEAAPASRRLLLMPVAFGAVTLAVEWLYRLAGWPQGYYFLKYGFHASAWLTAAAIALVPALCGRAWEETRTSVRMTQAAAGALGLAGILLAATALRGYWPSFRERAFGHPPYTQVLALTDLELVDRARAVLEREGARSGGVLDPSWPRSNFLNASLDSFNAFDEGWARWTAGKVEQGKGRCVFWLEGRSAGIAWAEAIRAQGRAFADGWRALTAAPDKHCSPHVRSWAGDPTLQLCYRCGPPAAP